MNHVIMKLLSLGEDFDTSIDGTVEIGAATIWSLKPKSKYVLIETTRHKYHNYSFHLNFYSE